MKKTRYDDYAKWTNFDVFSNYTVRIVFSSDLRKSAMGRLGHMPADESAVAFVFHVHNRSQSYIFLPLDTSESTVAHEAWHVVHKVLKCSGVEEFDDEVVAYHLGWLVRQIYQFKNQISEKKHDQRKRRTGNKKRR
jgi:hypothetical protein